MKMFLKAVCLLLTIYVVTGCHCTPEPQPLEKSCKLLTTEKTLDEQSSYLRRFSYNGDGNLDSVISFLILNGTTNFNGFFSYEYDPAHRLTKLTYHTAQKQPLQYYQYAYGITGKVSEIQYFTKDSLGNYVPDSKMTYTYDSNEQLSKAIMATDQVESSYVFAYDSRGNVTKLTTELHGRVHMYEYTYDDRKNPFYDSHFTPFWLNADELSPHNIVSRNDLFQEDPTKPLITVSYTYKYNEKGLPVQRTVVSPQGRSQIEKMTYLCQYKEAPGQK